MRIDEILSFEYLPLSQLCSRDSERVRVFRSLMSILDFCKNICPDRPTLFFRFGIASSR